MWNALISALLLRASIVMIDGNPVYPDIDFQWRLAAETEATMLGLSPAFLMGCRKAGVRPAETYDLSHLKEIGSAGSPLPAEGFDGIYEQLGPAVLLNNGSGGTDVCTGIVQGSPMQPVYRGEIAGRCLAVDTAAFDFDGNEVVGELGELVVARRCPRCRSASGTTPTVAATAPRISSSTAASGVTAIGSCSRNGEAA